MQFHRSVFVSLAAVLTALAPVASAAEAAKLRELTADRPDATESPFTVDPGHVQVEMDFANYTRDREGGVRTVEWEAIPFNLRFGLTRNFEAGIFLTPYHRTSETPRGGPRETHAGVGDTMLRAKLNFFGNDGGATAAGLIVDLKLPTGPRTLSNGKYEGALTFPVAFQLGGGWGGGAMTSIGAAYTDAGRHCALWANTVTVGRDLTENVGGFLEITSETGVGRHVASFNCGLTRAVGPQAQLDCGVNLGLSRAAPDVAFFAGWSRKF